MNLKAKIPMKNQKNKEFLNTIILGDSINILSEIDENSIDVVLTDPPYFLDKLDSNWNPEKVSNKRNQQRIKSLPAGMKFTREQGVEFYKWYFGISKEIFRVLKPGGFFFSFSSPRLYHRMASAVDDAGFEIRDCFLWIYTQNQAKAMSLNHLIEKMDGSKEDKEKLKEKLNGWKTPQIKSSFEPIVMAQKPTDGTFLNNVIKNGVGLFNTLVPVGENMFPSNIFTIQNINEVLDKHFLIGKPGKKEKGEENFHMTVKPIELCKHLIDLSVFSKPAIILDPFMGSGTTAIACIEKGHNFIGIEKNPEYIEIANNRIKKCKTK